MDAVQQRDDQKSLSFRWREGQHLPELDGIRGFAILIVTLYRYSKEIDPEANEILAWVKRLSPIGERGVDLFFVLSGLLITGILLRTRSRPFYFRNFMARRALRIFPLYGLALLICLYLIPWLGGPASFRSARSEQLYLWTYTSNMRMSWLNDWCFGPLDHFWSLAVEEHFYLVWPVVVFWLAPKRLFAACLAWAILVLAARTFFAQNSSYGVAVDVHTFFRSDALCLGGMVAIAIHANLFPKQLRILASVLIPTLFLLCLGVALTGKRYFAIPNTLVPVLFAATIYWMLETPQSGWLNKLTRWSPLRSFGKYSYGMYVIQLPLVTLVPAASVQGLLPDSFRSTVSFYLAYVAVLFGVTFALAWISYHGYEKHFLAIKKRYS